MTAEMTKTQTRPQIHNQNSQNSQKENIRPEAELLLRCIRYHFDTASSGEIAELLRTDIDWDYLIQKAAEHNVFLLFYQSLKNACPELIPGFVAGKLQVEAQRRIAGNLFLTQQLFQVLDLFAANDIQVVPFKGLIWATLAYGNMALREFCDLDILVRPRDFSKAKELLVEQGYHDKFLGSKEQEIAQVQMVRKDGQVKIDLHFGLVPQEFYLQLDSESFFEGLQTVSIAGRDIATFSPENSLALGYIHGTKDNWGLLKRICDFAALIRTYPDVDWQNVVPRCGTNYSDRSFWLGAAIVKTYLQISLPEELKKKIEQFPELSEIAEQHKGLFYRAELGYKCHLLGRLSLFPRMEMGFWGKVRYSLELALDVNEKDKEIFALPNLLFFLYYPLRIVRLIKTYKIGKEKIAFLWDFLRRS